MKKQLKIFLTRVVRWSLSAWLVFISISGVCHWISWGVKNIQNLSFPSSMCAGFCNFNYIVGGGGVLLFLSLVVVWVALCPPNKLRFFLWTAFWTTCMLGFFDEVMDFAIDPLSYPYPSNALAYVTKIYQGILLWAWSLVGLLLGYLSSRKRVWGIILHLVVTFVALYFCRNVLFSSFQ